MLWGLLETEEAGHREMIWGGSGAPKLRTVRDTLSAGLVLTLSSPYSCGGGVFCLEVAVCRWPLRTLALFLLVGWLVH